MSNLFRIAGSLVLITLGYALGHLSQTASDPVQKPRASVFAPDTGTAPLDDALLRAMLEPDVLTRAGLTARVLATLPPDRVDSVLATLDQVALAPGDIEIGLIAMWLARADPAAALEWSTSEHYTYHAWVIAAVMRAWAQQDPQGAARAFAGMRGAAQQGATLSALVLGWDEGGHPGMVDFMLGIEQGEVPQVAIESLVQRMVVRDGPQAAMRWAESLPADRPEVISRFKRNALRRVASAVAVRDPELAWEWAASFGEGQYGRGAYRRVAMETARTDGPGTMQWLGTLPAGAQRDGAMQEAYRVWLSADRDAALAWLPAQPDDEWLDGAHAVYAQALVVIEGHEAAMEWVGKIDQNLRLQRTAMKIGRAWFQKYPEQAKAWAANPPEWASAETIEVVGDPTGARERAQQERQEKRAAAAARRAARKNTAATPGETADAHTDTDATDADPDAEPGDD